MGWGWEGLSHDDHDNAGRRVVGGSIIRKKLRDVQQERKGTSLNYFNVIFNYFKQLSWSIGLSQSILDYPGLSRCISVHLDVSRSISVHLGLSRSKSVYLGLTRSNSV